MKRLRSSDDLDPSREKGVVKEWVRREEDSALYRPSSSLNRSSYYNKSSDGGRKVSSSSGFRYDRLEDDREGLRLVRKRSDYELGNNDRRKGYEYDRGRDANERGTFVPSQKAGYGTNRMHRSESLSVPRRDFQKGFRLERDRSRREGSVTSWRRSQSVKNGDDWPRSGREFSHRRREMENVGKPMSPQATRDAKSPAWSKDSGCEQSKSIEVKQNEDIPVESGGQSGEREEGELEPDPQPFVPSTEPINEDSAAVEPNLSQEDLNNEEHNVDNKIVQDNTSFLSVENKKQAEDEGSQNAVDVLKEKDSSNSKNSKNTSVQDTDRRRDGNETATEIEDNDDLREGNKAHLQEDAEGAFDEHISLDESETVGEPEGGENLAEGSRESHLQEDAEGIFDEHPSLDENETVTKTEGGEILTEGRRESHLDFDENSSPLQEGGDDQDIDLDMKAKDNGFTETIKESEMPLTDETAQIGNDKGESVAEPPSCNTRFSETNTATEEKQSSFGTSENIEMEGSSSRGFQFFLSDRIIKQEKVEQSTYNNTKDDEFALDLSLSLPNVLLPIGSQYKGQAPGSPCHTKSIQSFPSSFRTNSDGFMASMSFSGSQQFTHNPSCSLTDNAYDFEQSVGSEPFQGVDWKALSSDDNQKKEIPAYLGTGSRDNGFHQESRLSQGNSSTLERQLSFNKYLPGPGSCENRPKICKDRWQVNIEKDFGGLKWFDGPNGKEQVLAFGADFAESIVTMIVSEPVLTMAQRFSQFTGQQITCIREFLLDIIKNPSKQLQMSTLQKTLRKRMNFAMDELLKVHRTQLEIMVALKTGIEEFLLHKPQLPSSDLAEIYLDVRCRNLTCRSLLPVDECDCKTCSQRKGFCRECMCLVCSEFDSASNTCSWVGCDVCLHWCHADCGLRESHIRNGHSALNAQGSREMQFHCVACGQPSEIFGFVKEVFQNFLKEWTAENLSRELEYVRNIFSACEDARGKLLHEISILMLSKLGDRGDLQEVQNHIMNFFTESNSLKPTDLSIETRMEIQKHNQEQINGFASFSNGPGWKTSLPDKATSLQSPINHLPAFGSSSTNNKYRTNMDLPTNAPKEPLFDELESIVRIKHAEAKMFQSRASDARREAEALKRIAVKKNKRIEEEYSNRIRKLRLVEAEEMRKQKMEELEALERAQRVYFSMKERMETAIKEVLLRMEATRRNLGT